MPARSRHSPRSWASDYATVKSSVLAAVQADLDAAVAEGGLSQERADAALERVTTWLDDGRRGRWLRGGHHRFGPWGGNDDEQDAEESGA